MAEINIKAVSIINSIWYVYKATDEGPVYITSLQFELSMLLGII